MIETIKEKTVLLINGIKHTAISKVCYFTKNNPDEYYYKIKFDDEKILIISEDLKDVLVGQEVCIEKIIDFPSPDKIVYNDSTFDLITSDYQFVKKVEFGNFGDYETECRFIDYVNEEGTQTLSIGIDTHNNRRDDALADVIALDDIEIIS